MSAKIFINYRRDDSASQALNIAQYFERRFGVRNVSIDIDRMQAGQKFPEVLEKQLSTCDVVLIVIGPHWLSLMDSNGRRRIDDPTDWVRLEIAHTLAKDLNVIPILVDGATMPPKTELPLDLQPLLERHAAAVTMSGFRSDMARLERDIRALRKPRPRVKIAVGVAMLLIVVFGIVLTQVRFLSRADIEAAKYQLEMQQRLRVVP